MGRSTPRSSRQVLQCFVERGPTVTPSETTKQSDEQVDSPSAGTPTRQSPVGLGDPAIVALLERAIAGCSQIEAVYEDDAGDEPRVFCPAAMGVLHGDRNLLVLQISGESSSGYEKGLERCLKVAKLRHVRLREGPWFAIEGDIRQANCFKYGTIETFSQCTGDPPRVEEPR
jgi:hypothetical protein